MNCPNCEKTIDEHEASRCLDAWVAEKVFELCSHFLEFEWTDEKGDRYCKCGKCGETIKHPELKFYSTDISAAWTLLEKIEKQLGIFKIMRYAHEGRTNFWRFEGPHKAKAQAKTVELAICRAVLKTVLE